MIEHSSIANLLQARGFRIVSFNPNDQLLTGILLDDRVINQYYKKLGRYSFRIFLRELLENQDDIRPTTVSHYCSESSAKRYLEFLFQLGLLRKEGETYRLAAEFVPNFGQTLEWYMAEVFKREFGAEAIYRVTLYKSFVGGDLDVLTNWTGKLVYLDIKSSPPKAVDAAQIHLFFSRMWELLPELAFFVEDTQLRMKDKIVSLFQQELARQYGPLGWDKFPVKRLADELFHINHCIYIVNSKKGLVHNLTVCLRDYLRSQQQLMGMP